MIELTIENRQSQVVIGSAEEALIQTAVETVLEIEGIVGEGELSLSIVDGPTIKELNGSYRGKDEVTDVLSFPQYDRFLEEKDSLDYLVIGDIVICAQRAQEQAVDFGHSFERELAYLTVHSLYHLFGYDHMEESDKRAMREKEEAALAKMGIGR